MLCIKGDIIMSWNKKESKPTEKGVYLVTELITVGYTDIIPIVTVAFYDENEWKTEEMVIAWCELPSAATPTEKDERSVILKGLSYKAESFFTGPTKRSWNNFLSMITIKDALSHESTFDRIKEKFKELYVKTEIREEKYNV